jgi:hypothetical protein
MKTNLLLFALAAAALAGTGWADNPQLRNQLDRERAATARTERASATVAVQVKGRGVGERRTTAPTTTRETTERMMPMHHGRGQTDYLPAPAD